MLAHNHFFHWPTALSMTFCDMLAHVSMRRCFKSLVTEAGVANRCLYNLHTFLHQSTNSVVNRTVWRTQIWRDKVRCFLLKELDCFTSIQWRQNASFPLQLFRSKINKVSKSGWTRKIAHAYQFWKYADAVYQKLSKLINACRNYAACQNWRVLRYSVDALLRFALVRRIECHRCQWRRETWK